MNHERFRELCTLDLYDELEADERRALEAHLEGCAACAGFAAELGADLGRLVGSPGVAELPSGWRERLEERLEPASSPGARRSWLPLAAGFAAGAALTWALTGGGATPRDIGSDARMEVGSAAAGGALERATPPPRARDRGRLTQLAVYLRR